MRRILTIVSAATLLATVISLPAAAVGPAAEWQDVIVGTSGDDTLVGSDLRDKIVGKAGNDVLRGGKARDLLLGGFGDDLLRGGAWNDRMFGGSGADRLFGGPGDDLLHGGPHADRLFGGAGNDTLRSNGDGARDRVDCGPGTKDVAFVDARDLVTGCETVTVTGQ